LTSIEDRELSRKVKKLAGEVKTTSSRTLAGFGMSVGGVVGSILSSSAVPFQKIVAAGSVNQEHDLVVVIANVIAIGISSNQPITIKTNSTGSPAETITVPAGGEIIWVSGVDPVGSKPLGTDLTKVYISVPGLVDATVKILLCVAL
jgi:hypothetical protein